MQSTKLTSYFICFVIDRSLNVIVHQEAQITTKVSDKLPLRHSQFSLLSWRGMPAFLKPWVCLGEFMQFDYVRLIEKKHTLQRCFHLLHFKMVSLILWGLKCS